MDAVNSNNINSSDMRTEPVAVSLAKSSDQGFNPPVLDWLMLQEARAIKHSHVFKDEKTRLLLQEIHSMELSSGLLPALLSFIAAVFYRYSYQNDFGLKYVKSNSETDTIDLLASCACFQFSGYVESSVAELSAAADARVTIDTHDTESQLASSIEFCLVDTTDANHDVLSGLPALFDDVNGVLWPVIENKDGALSLSWLCCGAISTEAMQMMQAHLLNLVERAKLKPNLPHSEHGILSDEEVSQQIGFSKTSMSEHSSEPIFRVIEKHAKDHPNKIAIKFNRKEFTYEQINNRANNLANFLIDKGVDVGGKIAVLLKPSENILVTLLAIHKSGGIYVPIDPTFPVARINIILDEVKPVATLVDSAGKVDVDLNLQKVVDIGALKLDGIACENPNVPVSNSDFSHVFFTSGTTGKPKGTVATHGNLIHYISASQYRYRFDANDVFISAARFTFSISLFELITPLYVGASINILPRELVLDMRRLSEEVAASTFFHFGPSLLKQLLPYIEENYDSFDVFDGLKHVSSGGDMVPPEVLEQLKKIFRNAEVYVIYGSSEISCMGCTYQAPRDKTIVQTYVGKPHQNVGVRIFDNKGNMVPIGVAGRVHFSGGGVVHGYLNMPSLTEERFPYIEEERFYDIGDIGRFDENGNIQLLGREDFQVQVRGMRIELIEIETCLKSFPLVRDCVLVAKTLKNQEEKSLIAYLVLSEEIGIEAADIIERAKQQLPDYMVPAVFVCLEKLPLNHNGKLDRSQLPEPTADNMLVSAAFEGAADDVEQELIDIWERLFGIEGIGVHHDFFELGGDSLLAVNFLIEIDKVFEKFIPISILMQASTIRDIAAMVASDQPVEGVGDVVVLRKGNSEPPLFCLYGVLLYKELAESIDTDRMVCGVYLEEEVSVMGVDVDQEALQALSTVEGIASRYMASIRAFQQVGPYYLCGESFGGIIALEVARQLEREGEEVKLVAMLDSVAPGFYESLSKFKRAFIHLKQLRRFGLSHLKKKIRQKDSKNQEPGQEIQDGRGAIRDSAAEQYCPQVHERQVTLFRATERSEFEPKQKDLGWSRFVRKVEVLDIDGTHLGILQKGKVERLAAQMLERME